MELHVTEHKSVGELRPAVTLNTVRVFVNQDYGYGYFVDERALLGLLGEAQTKAYLEAKDDFKVDVSPEVAQQVIDMGHTPYAKARVV